jgi:glycosyltransferase involved in cell wall biosynthesis
MWKISVLLPCYNGTRWISRAVESILAQTYEDFELVIIDDGSTDNSKEMVALFLSDKRVRYIYQENRGFSAAVNKGIKESKGDLIGFIGQDDLWLPNKLESQVEYLSNHKDVDLVHSNYFSIDPRGRIIGKRNVEMQNVSSKRKLIEELFLGNFIGFETVLVKRKCFERVGFFDEHMVGFSDYDMWLRIAGSFNIEGYVDLPLVKKREHRLQLSIIRLDDVLRDELLIVKKAIERYPFLKKLERKKLGPLYYALGIVLLQKGNKDEAKQKLLKAIRCQPWKLKATAAYMAPTLYALVLDHYQGFAQAHTGLSWIEG